MSFRNLAKKIIEAPPLHLYQIIINPADYSDFKKTLNQILKLIENKESVPYELLDEFKSYLHDRETIIYRLYSEKMKEILEKAILFFQKRKDYQFNLASIDEISKEPITGTLPGCVERILIDYFAGYLSKQIHPEDATIQAMAYLFPCVNTYLNKFGEEGKVTLSPYQRMAIAGYISECLGYYVGHSNPDKPIMHDYFQAGKNIIRKQKKKN